MIVSAVCLLGPVIKFQQTEFLYEESYKLFLVKRLKAEDEQKKFSSFYLVLSQAVRGGSGYGQGDGCHGTDKSLHQPAGEEPTCESQR